MINGQLGMVCRGLFIVSKQKVSEISQDIDCNLVFLTTAQHLCYAHSSFSPTFWSKFRSNIYCNLDIKHLVFLCISGLKTVDMPLSPGPSILCSNNRNLIFASIQIFQIMYFKKCHQIHSKNLGPKGFKDIYLTR